MNMLLDSFEDCTMLDRTTVADGYGGFISTWADGAPFQAVVNLDDSTAARVAAVQGVTGRYTVITKATVELNEFDVFRRESDGLILRVTDKPKKTPQAATMGLRKVKAEEWRMPNADEE